MIWKQATRRDELNPSQLASQLFRRVFEVWITVVGFVVRRDLMRRAVFGFVEIELAARLINDRRFVFRPTWVREPDLFSFLVREWLCIGNPAALGIEIRDVKRASGNSSFEPRITIKRFLSL